MWSQHIELSRASVVTVCMVLQQQLLSRGVGSITISSSFVNLPVQNLIEVSFILLGCTQYVPRYSIYAQNISIRRWLRVKYASS